LSGLVFTKLWDYVNGKNPSGTKASTSVTGKELQQLGVTDVHIHWFVFNCLCFKFSYDEVFCSLEFFTFI